MPRRKPPTKEEKKKLAHEEVEKLVEIGQESETKAAKAVIELSKEDEKKTKEEEARVLEQLEKERKRPKIFSYKERLAMRIAQLIKEEDIPLGWKWGVEVLPKGVGVEIISPNGKMRKQRKFAISGDIRYDSHACHVFAQWVGDNVRSALQEKKTSGGIILPS